MENKKINRIIALGDTHGRTNWKQVVENEIESDKIIFIGDYFDSFVIHPYAQLNNFLDILDFKKSNPDKVVLLIGNHDFHYLSGIESRCSGFQPKMYHLFNEVLEPAFQQGLLQMAYQHENFLFTHAGVTSTWANNNNVDYSDLSKVANEVNNRFVENRMSFAFTDGRNYSSYGDDIEQTPIWVRPNSLNKKKIEGLINVVGHTGQPSLKPKGDIILIDTMETSGEYLVINDLKMSVKNV